MTDLTVETPDEAVVPEAPEPAPVRKKRRPALVVLSILAVLLVGTSITFGVLYANQTSRNASLAAQVSGKEQGVADSAKKVQENAEKLTKSQEALKTAGEARQKAETDSAPLATCHEAAKKAIKSHFTKDEAAYQDALTALYSNC